MTMASPKLLEEYSLAFSGRFPGYTHMELRELAESLLASVSLALSRHNTHLVCQEASYNSNAKAIGVAKASSGIHLVKLEWLEDVKKSRCG